jgi:hypothetical protein
VSAGGILGLSLLGINVFLDVKTAMLSMTVPLAILVGLAGAYLWSAFRKGGQIIARASVVSLLCLGMVAGITNLPPLVQEKLHISLRPADWVAMRWIEKNVSPKARFAVNGIEPYFSRGWVVGVDAGYWIPLLAHRASTIPPMIYTLEWGNPEELPTMLEAARDTLFAQQREPLPEQPILDRLPITHILIDGKSDSLALLELVKMDNRVVEIYHLDRLRIFEVAR